MGEVVLAVGVILVVALLVGLALWILSDNARARELEIEYRTVIMERATAPGLPNFYVQEDDRRATRLLLRHLTQDQQREFKTTGTFTVRTKSGRVYEVNAMGIYQIKNGQRRFGCWGPHLMYAGDVMLARKIDLLLCEQLVLTKANWSAPESHLDHQGIVA